MSGRRMEITKEALKLFIQSLPVGCTFAILGFGSHSEFVSHQSPQVKQRKNANDSSVIWTYNDDIMPQILSEISVFAANFGGTNILDPLKKATELDIGKRKRRVFLLTDGEVENKDQVIAQARKNCEKTRVHAFGIGNGCDRELIKQTAIAGRGSFSFATDNSSNLSGQVIQALKKATQPSLMDCKFSWSDKKIELGEVFRNQLVQSYQILTKAEFDALKVRFTSSKDPITN